MIYDHHFIYMYIESLGTIYWYQVESSYKKIDIYRCSLYSKN